jgi:tryptophan-rich sensory protein
LPSWRSLSSAPQALSPIGRLIPNIPVWYAGLVKPSFSPPNWLFGPVWTVLYLMMAIAFWRILRLPAATPGRAIAIGSFLVQMALNAFGSITFSVCTPFWAGFL